MPDEAVVRLVRNFELIFVAEGRTWVWCEPIGGSIDIAEGDVIFVPPGVLWAWPIASDIHYSVHFDLHANPDLVFPDVFEWSSHPPVRRNPVKSVPVFELSSPGPESRSSLSIPFVSRPQNPEQWRENLESLARLFRTHTLHTTRGQVQATNIITWMVLSLDQADTSKSAGTGKIDHRLDELLLELNDPRERVRFDNVSTTQMARNLQMGLKSFRKAFRAATNRNPNEYMIERRMEQAAQMLAHSYMKVGEIAESLGYDNVFYFSRVFRNVYDVSPRQYRRQIGLSGPRSRATDATEADE
jgi:AraC-like DNA-binding protein